MTMRSGGLRMLTRGSRNLGQATTLSHLQSFLKDPIYIRKFRHITRPVLPSPGGHWLCHTDSNRGDFYISLNKIDSRMLWFSTGASRASMAERSSIRYMTPTTSTKARHQATSFGCSLIVFGCSYIFSRRTEKYEVTL